VVADVAFPTRTENRVAIPSRAWYGDIDLELDFPQGWEVHMLGPKDAPRVTPAQIETAFANPIGTRRLSELARGRRSAAIVVDDLSRPTPAAELVPYALRELAEAGVPKEEIRFVAGGGSHRPLTREELAKKVGADIVEQYEVTSHDFMAGDLRGLGNLPDGTPLYFNRVVADADFKMTIGGIYPHGSVGFGGGSKLILPGVAGFATMFHFHTFYANRGQGNIERTGDVPDHRDASEAAAKALGLDAVVNVVLNSRRQIAGVFVGDFVQAHRAGARYAKGVYATPIPERLRNDAALIVLNAYPLDSDPIQTGKALWPRQHFTQAYTLVVNPAVDGICYHGLFDRMDWGRFRADMAKRAPMSVPEVVMNGREQSLLWSENFPIHDLSRKLPNTQLVRTWETAIDALRTRLPENAVVAVFPCSAIQILEND
jgi:nickel-dependent lactate racemase